MASRAVRLFAPLQLAAAVATLKTATNVRIVIKKLLVCNTTGTARLVTFHLVVAATAASATNTFIYQKTLLAGQTFDFSEANNLVLENGDFLAGFADAATAVSCHAFGIETDV